MVDKYLALTGKDQERFEATMGEDKEIETMVDLWQEDLEAYRAHGEARGELKEARRAIMLLAKSRKVEVAENFEDDLEAIDDLARLHRILEQTPDVRSTDELDLDKT